ncbi:Zinc finger, TAZ-type [Phytophthora cactorum]|nr:Zinc finger, TAZ-type [Phytophthora cactorum]
MSDVRIKQERANGSKPNGDGDTVAHEVAQSLGGIPAAVGEDEMDRTNALLMHACNCDDAHSVSACGLLGLAQRKWRSYPIGNAVIELFAYHALHCQALQCNVPMCRQLRGQVLL